MMAHRFVINDLVSLLGGLGVRDVVLCPGSRNAPLVHALSHGLEKAVCHSVVDERSAGFYALGLSLGSGLPVVVCCTSGSAVANLLPAVSEAFYQGVPLIIVSADRPECWLGQQAGQTLPQRDLFGAMVRRAVYLPEPHSDEDRWYCNRLLNEALLGAFYPVVGPVHINIPISNPIVCLQESPEVALPIGNTAVSKRLQGGRLVRHHFSCQVEAPDLGKLLERLGRFERKMILVGQRAWGVDLDKGGGMPFPQSLREHCLCIGESLCNSEVEICSLDALLGSLSEEGRRSLQPDLLITLGGHVVSNKMKQYLRDYPPMETWQVSPDPAVVDLFWGLTDLVTTRVEPFLEAVVHHLNRDAGGSRYAEEWRERIAHLPAPQARFCSLGVIGCLLSKLPREGVVLHLANSSAVRYAELFRKDHLLLTFCNRGTSGIEGSLSTALGFARRRPELLHVLVIGDLSFFYDLNALGLPEVGSNVRVLLLNNQQGSIFHSLPGLEMDTVSERYITATHCLQAKGWAESCGWEYLSVHDEKELAAGMSHLAGQADRPRLLEAFLSSEDEMDELKNYFKQLKQIDHDHE